MQRSGRYLTGLILAAILAAASVALVKEGVYGLTVFLVFPVVLGGLSAWVFKPNSGWGAAGVGALAVVAASLFFLLGGMEGLVCIVMAVPLAAPLGALGAWVVYRSASPKLEPRGIAMLLLVPTATLTWDVKAPPPVFCVRTAVEIAAPPERVWKYVVSFPALPEPREWFFRAGVAYPLRAHIDGSGLGAVRYCEFSTGPFVEPIEVWDAPRLLRFRVTENPAPLQEWSPYAQIEPKHLHGYLVSKQG